jgi:hypothetical protein
VQVFEPGHPKMRDVHQRTRLEVVNADHTVVAREQLVAQM